MGEKTTSHLSAEMLPAIRAIACDGAVKASTGSLFIWGAINLGAWIILGAESRDFLAGLSNPSDDIYVLLYGTAVIGAVMLLFGLIGATLRLSLTALLDGVSLLAIGLWNITHDFFAMAALRPYGYTIEKPSTMWIILGICQLVWGFREFAKFGRIVRWGGAHISASDKDTAKQALSSLIKQSEDLASGCIKASMTINGPLGLDILSKTEQYFGQISDETAILVTNSMDNYFSINKKSMFGATWGERGVLTVYCGDDKTRTISLGSLSVFALKSWADVPVTAPDILFLSSEKKATIELLMPFIRAESVELKSAAAEALGTLDNKDSRKMLITYLTDGNSTVRVAAVKSVKALKMIEAEAYVIKLLYDTDKDVRKDAAQSLVDIASSDALPQIEEALSVETEKTIRKELQRAMRKIRSQKTNSNFA